MGRDGGCFVILWSAPHVRPAVGSHQEVPLVLIVQLAAVGETRATSVDEVSNLGLNPSLLNEFALGGLLGCLTLFDTPARWIPEARTLLVTVIEQQEDMIGRIEDEHSCNGSQQLGGLVHCLNRLNGAAGATPVFGPNVRRVRERQGQQASGSAVAD
jgi:hypothetical protein